MRTPKYQARGSLEFNMTPMIDVTFQLIAFFMFTLNFSGTNLDARVSPPAAGSSAPSPPSRANSDRTLVIQVAGQDEFILAGRSLQGLDELEAALMQQRRSLSASAPLADDVTIVIRADQDAAAGDVQGVIQRCQALKFRRFALRAQQP